MADKKISQLTDLPAASVSPSNDVLAIVDTNVTETKKITAKALVDGALNAGTANGLVYLNGSKETTTGSIITYDGTTFGVDDAVVINESGGDNDTRIEGDTDANLFFVDASTDRIGIGTSSPGEKLNVIGGGATTSTVNFTGGAANDNATIASDYSLVFQVDANNTVGGRVFNWRYGGNGYQGGTSLMTLDASGNLGVGYTSPAYRLHIASAIDTYTLAIRDTGTGNDRILIGPRASAPIDNIIAVQIANDNDGNLLLSSRTNNASGIKFYTNAGTAASLRATLDSAGNLGLGVTPSAWGSGNVAIQTGVTGAFWNYSAGGTQVSNNYVETTASKYIVNGYATTYVQEKNTGTHAWYVAPSGTAGNTITFTQAMTLDASGQLLLGTTSNLGTNRRELVLQSANGSILNLGINGAVDSFQLVCDSGPNALIINKSNTPMIFYTNNTERARITSGGNLLVGTTVGGARIYTEISSATADDSALFASNFNSGASGVCAINTSLGASGSANNTNCYHIRSITQGSATYYLYGNGTTSFTSDERLKKNIVSARDGYLNDVLNLRVVKYQWQSNSEDSMSELGLIAQEVEQVFPGLVQDADVEINGITPKVVKFSVLPFILLKAIQELSAKNDALEARLAALEAK